MVQVRRKADQIGEGEKGGQSEEGWREGGGCPALQSDHELAASRASRSGARHHPDTATSKTLARSARGCTTTKAGTRRPSYVCRRQPGGHEQKPVASTVCETKMCVGQSLHCPSKNHTCICSLSPREKRVSKSESSLHTITDSIDASAVKGGCGLCMFLLLRVKCVSSAWGREEAGGEGCKGLVGGRRGEGVHGEGWWRRTQIGVEVGR